MPAKKQSELSSASADPAAQPPPSAPTAMPVSAKPTVQKLEPLTRGALDLNKLELVRNNLTYDGSARGVFFMLNADEGSLLPVKYALPFDGKHERPIFLFPDDPNARGHKLNLHVTADAGLVNLIQQLEDKVRPSFPNHEWISMLKEDVLRVGVVLGEGARGEHLTMLQIANEDGSVVTKCKGWKEAEEILRETEGLRNYEVGIVAQLKVYAMDGDRSTSKAVAGLRLSAVLLKARMVLVEIEDILGDME